MHFKQLAGLFGLIFYLTTGWAQSLSIETDTVSIHARRLEDLGAGHCGEGMIQERLHARLHHWCCGVLVPAAATREGTGENQQE